MTCPNCEGADSSTFELTCISCGVRLVKQSGSGADPKLAVRLQKQKLAHIEHCAGPKVAQEVFARLKGQA